MIEPLDNPAWTALTTVLAPFAEGDDRARQVRSSVSAFAAMATADEESWQRLARLAGPSADLVVCHADGVDPPAPWTYVGGGAGHQMLLTDVPDLPVPPGTRPLVDADVDEMVALVRLTEPGPFRRGTIELGGYQGVFEDGRLIAMAGRRLQTPTHTEISAVCTHPDARRRGLAAAITAVVARGIVADGRTPMLHVSTANDGARRVYEGLGFRTRTLITFAAVRTPA